MQENGTANLIQPLNALAAAFLNYAFCAPTLPPARYKACHRLYRVDGQEASPRQADPPTGAGRGSGPLGGLTL
jgi:hypothetical protein